MHTDEDEAVYVLEGEMLIVLDGTEATAGPGDAVAFLRGIAHGFFNRSDKRARLLITATPGTAFEAFFDELDDLSSKPEPDMPAVFELAGRFGMTFVDTPTPQ